MRSTIRRVLIWLGFAVPTVLASSARSEPSASRLRLTAPVPTALPGSVMFPLAPLRFSIAPITPRFGWNAAQPMFRADSLWFEQGRLSLRSFASIDERGELDCALSCYAVTERVFGLETRVSLAGGGRGTETYAFLRGENVWSRGVSEGRLRLGWGGTLDF